jgi:hypothetical protein
MSCTNEIPYGSGIPSDTLEPVMLDNTYRPDKLSSKVEHGKTELERAYEILDFFNKMGDVTLLITLNETLDEYMLDYNHAIEKKFIESCRIMETIYKDIMFCGGYREYDEKQLYEFEWEKKNGMPNILAPDDWSVAYRFVQKWCPFLVKKFNKYYIEKYDNFKGFLMLSYVNRR